MKKLNLILTIFYFSNLGQAAHLKSLPKDIHESILDFLSPQTLLTYKQTEKSTREDIQDIFKKPEYRKRHINYWSQKDGLFHPAPWQSELFKKIFTVTQNIMNDTGPQTLSVQRASIVIEHLKKNIEDEIAPFRAPTCHTQPLSKVKKSVYDKAAQTLVEITLQNLTRAYVLNTTLQYIDDDEISLTSPTEAANSEWLDLLENEILALREHVPHSSHMPHIPGRPYDQRFSHDHNLLLEGYTHSILLQNDSLALHMELEVHRHNGFRSIILMDHMAHAETSWVDTYRDLRTPELPGHTRSFSFEVADPQFEDKALTNLTHQMLDLIDWKQLRRENNEDLTEIYQNISSCIARIFQIKTLMFRATPEYRTMIQNASNKLKQHFSSATMQQWLNDFVPSYPLDPENSFLQTRQKLYEHAKEGFSTWDLKYIP